jgi:glycosyltransferase involved in cell wall biosynthesis
MPKKKILYHSDFSLLKTGFGRAARLILTHLYNTEKYDIVHLCCGLVDGHPEFERVPWKCYGAIPRNAAEQSQMQKDPKLAQLASYGAGAIDTIMKEEKPDIYIGVQDIWGVDFATSKGWWRDSNMAIWTTLDSLPILPMAVNTAKKVKNFWCWSDFATKSLHNLGHKHIKTLRGPLDESLYYRLSNEKRLSLRGKFNISPDEYVIGFVFRNQLRKSVPNLLAGYKDFLKKNPSAKTKLLLHTNFSEGWGIHKLADEYELDKQNILTTYVCSGCGAYGIHPFVGQEQKCPHCYLDKSYSTTGINSGVSEEQLNEVYNLMDVYCHPFTSGGQEIPIQEAKLTELITLVTNYSCGVDSCTDEACSLPLDWSEYREHGTEFIKASTKEESIAKQLEKVYEMPAKEKEKMGQRARRWVIDNFSISKIGKELESFMDSAPVIDTDIVYSIKNNKNPEALIDGDLPDEEWIISLYKNTLDMNVDNKDQGYQYWMKEIKNGTPRKDIDAFFRQTAKKEIAESEGLEALIDKEDGGKRILYVIPESAGDVIMATSLFESAAKQYPDHKLYVATNTQYMDLVRANPYVYKIIPFSKEMEDIHFMEGWGNRPPTTTRAQNHDGFFDVVFLSYINAQIIPNYTHNGKDRIAFDIKV